LKRILKSRNFCLNPDDNRSNVVDTVRSAGVG